jgi:purine-binding chemotaxis protein CheW
MSGLCFKREEESRLTSEQALADELQIVAFTVAEGEYAVNILDVQEINRLPWITRVPKTPAFMEGVINLRGDVIPVIDMHKRLGLASFESTDKTRVVIVSVGDIKVGIIVDEVLEVLRLPKQDIEPPPSAGSGASEFLQGVGKMGNRLLLLMDLEQLLGITNAGN